MNAMKNFHVPLPTDLYSKLRALAEQHRRPATELAREAIAAWIEQRRRDALHRAIAEYAEQCAGTEADFDTSLEATGVEHLLEDNGW
jgi:predicted transcriptional regulator